ncbi:NAD(P)H-dependent oxidoreductase [Bacilliculturomica massiliensis]|uniref:NAD(P)H-dependent oxidoreductase n=1 Tax=Bacilliculturomica massiliensis TaxID=1917867 RepID=UPI0010310774|nr:NAD(P)H-dependent oxidoreductase [Bacilliculturomica massiliensis]
MHILFVNGCMREEGRSRTERIARVFLEELKKQGTFSLEEVDLRREEIRPVRGEDLLLRDRASAAGDFSGPLFERARRFAAADRIVIAAPLWDLSFPSMLKVYLENICVTGLTFRYTEDGVQGLCRADRLMYITTRGGDFSLPYMRELEQAAPYLRSLCFMLGIGSMDTVAADGLDIIGHDVEAIVKRAEKEAAEKAADFLRDQDETCI